MAWEDPPAVLTQLRTQLVACAGWANGSSAVHYPTLDDVASAAAFPVAVLAELAPTANPYAVGATPLAGGRLAIIVYGTATIGTMEALGRTLLGQLLAQLTGIPFQPAECSISSNPSPGMIAGAANVRSIQIELPWGLTV